MDAQDPSDELPGQMNVGGMKVFQRAPVMQPQGQNEGNISVPISVGGWMDLNQSPHTDAVSPVGGGPKSNTGAAPISVGGDQDEWVRLNFELFSRTFIYFSTFARRSKLKKQTKSGM